MSFACLVVPDSGCGHHPRQNARNDCALGQVGLLLLAENQSACVAAFVPRCLSRLYVSMWPTPRGVVPACSDGGVSSRCCVVVEDHDLPASSQLETLPTGRKTKNGQAAVALSAGVAIDSTRRMSDPVLGASGFTVSEVEASVDTFATGRHENASSPAREPPLLSSKAQDSSLGRLVHRVFSHTRHFVPFAGKSAERLATVVRDLHTRRPRRMNGRHVRARELDAATLRRPRRRCGHGRGAREQACYAEPNWRHREG
jgi:hypothetical protein